MTRAQLRRRIVRAMQRAGDALVTEAGRDPKAMLGTDYAYTSGYAQGLADVLAVMRGVPPAWARKFWPEEPPTPPTLPHDPGDDA